MRATVVLVLSLLLVACAAGAPAATVAAVGPRVPAAGSSVDPPAPAPPARDASADGEYRYLPPRRAGVPSYGLAGRRARVPSYSPRTPDGSAPARRSTRAPDVRWVW